MPIDYREVAKACRGGAKLYAAFKDGEEFASQMEQAEHLITNAHSELSRLTREVEQARVDLVQAQAQAATSVQEAKERVATLITEATSKTIPAERERALAESVQAQAALKLRQDDLDTRLVVLAERERTMTTREAQFVEARRAFTVEEARVAKIRTQIREEAQKAISNLSG